MHRSWHPWLAASGLGATVALGFAAGVVAAAASPTPPAQEADPDGLPGGCGSCHDISVRCLDRGSDVSAAARVHAIEALARCHTAGHGDQARVREALVAGAIQQDEAARRAVATALVETGALSAEAAADLPSARELDRGVARLLGRRKDRFRKLAGVHCNLAREGAAGALEFYCRTFDGCLRACRDRVLSATLLRKGGRWSLGSVNESGADTGACGHCM